MAKKKAATPTVKEATEGFSVSINIANDITKGSGATLLEALQAAFPTFIKNKAVLTATYNGRSYSQLFNVPMLKKLRVSKMLQIMVATRLERAIK